MNEWLYLTLGDDGLLRDDDGEVVCNTHFLSNDQAEKYLIDEDIRATLR